MRALIFVHITRRPGVAGKANVSLRDVRRRRAHLQVPTRAVDE
jgi:hypothetical protein